ncbi:hypothetical protein NU09_1516 [Flavobacterium beibuense]|uniref:Uncharacterized protein n=1 Tax=Flavobacterium beibuense TaxID=657326 RepID=A0A444WBI7_9FLAO|nr:hypothetical protein NU09_1516 [Flavobacterium beibuense]
MLIYFTGGFFILDKNSLTLFYSIFEFFRFAFYTSQNN